VLYQLFHEHEGRRIVIACFASHIHRVQQIADAAVAFGPQGGDARPVDEEERAAGPGDGPAAASPRTMLVDIDGRARPAAPARVCVISTGAARASRLSALALMAQRNNRWPGARLVTTRVILSSHPIPGNRDERVAR
jgi:ribonuclease J